ncbi:hypothetical protein Goari_004613 [Gossypium aridum]|uniref:DUF4283 domain-containing protein n=1 Tax=Gossypium aridum TaxID=34290 RepID=A0A7J8Y4G0_GOSAI|nr:hypothetical protein [Gossypium aridum]
MANVWHPTRGVQILGPGDKRFLFKFFHKIDLERDINGAPWTFNIQLLVFHQLEKGEDPVKNDSFCQIRMLREEESIEMGWDLSIRAQSRRATAMSSDKGGFVRQQDLGNGLGAAD